MLFSPPCRVSGEASVNHLFETPSPNMAPDQHRARSPASRIQLFPPLKTGTILDGPWSFGTFPVLNCWKTATRSWAAAATSFGCLTWDANFFSAVLSPAIFLQFWALSSRSKSALPSSLIKEPRQEGRGRGGLQLLCYLLFILHSVMFLWAGLFQVLTDTNPFVLMPRGKEGGGMIPELQVIDRQGKVK